MGNRTEKHGAVFIFFFIAFPLFQRCREIAVVIARTASYNFDRVMKFSLRFRGWKGLLSTRGNRNYDPTVQFRLFPLREFNDLDLQASDKRKVVIYYNNAVPTEKYLPFKHPNQMRCNLLKNPNATILKTGL